MATKRKGRRFDEGGMTDEDVSSFAGTPENESNAGMAEAYEPPTSKKSRADDEAVAPKKQSFKEAFAEARKGGGKSFEWNGKKYTTELASAKPAAKPAAKPMGGSGRGGQGGPTAEELDREAFKRTEKRMFTPPSKEDTQKGLEIAAGAPGLKAVAAAARGLASRAPRAAQAVREYIQPQLAAPTRRLTGPAAKEVADATPKMLPGPKAAAAEKAVSSAGREEVTNPLMWMAGPKNAGKFKGAEKAKKRLDESDTTGGAVGYKKGGSVRGWGIARGARKAKIV